MEQPQDPSLPLPRNIRLKGVIVAESMLRLMRLAIDMVDTDLEAFAVYFAVVAASTSHLLRDPQALALYAHDAPVPDHLRAATTRRGIAESVGLPRETVRRKIASLVAQGHIVERDGMVTTAGSVLDQRRNLAFVLSALAEYERTGTMLKRAEEL